ncbi:MAG: undecaprenyl-diphosphate phosphatase [Chthoniobacteraceae bacterium]|jgi:undecaprenyl-diphosphatase
MAPTYLQILILAIIQGAAELLPVSSSAHVIVVEKLMGLDPSSPPMTMLLVMLHTGTMFAVIVYFWNGWRRDYFSSRLKGKDFIVQVIVATVCTLVVYKAVEIVAKKVLLHGSPDADIEDLFSNLALVGGALLVAGILIIYAGIRSERSRGGAEVQLPHSLWIGFVQGFCVPFRGFSRSGATISTGLLLGLSKEKLEEFSFALAVVLTPLAIGKEGLRLLKATKAAGVHIPLTHLLAPSLVGMVFSFAAGLLALKWLSRWLEGGQWKLFGFYCVAASIAVLALHYTMGL